MIRLRDKQKKYCDRKCAARVNGERRRGTSLQGNFHGRRIHGYTLTHKLEYFTWLRIRRRCLQNPHYIAKDIRVDSRWWIDPKPFIEYVLQNLGSHPGKGWSIDRIDGTRGYEPGNIRWATNAQQRRNRLDYLAKRKDINSLSDAK